MEFSLLFEFFCSGTGKLFFFGPEEGSESLFYLAFRAKFSYCIEDKECRNKGIGRLTS